MRMAAEMGGKPTVIRNFTHKLLLRLWVTLVELVFVGLVVGVEALLKRRDVT